MFTLLDALPSSKIPAQASIAAGIHDVLAVCKDLLRQEEVRQAPGADDIRDLRAPRVEHRLRRVPGIGRRVVRAVVPLRARRVVGRLLERTLERLLKSL
jgi:hypothetical protein